MAEWPLKALIPDECPKCPQHIHEASGCADGRWHTRPFGADRTCGGQQTKKPQDWRRKRLGCGRSVQVMEIKTTPDGIDLWQCSSCGKWNHARWGPPPGGWVYCLWWPATKHVYVGSTTRLWDRIDEHAEGRDSGPAAKMPWGATQPVKRAIGAVDEAQCRLWEHQVREMISNKGTWTLINEGEPLLPSCSDVAAR